MGIGVGRATRAFSVLAFAVVLAGAGDRARAGIVSCSSYLDCNDFVDCTADSCNFGVCQHTPVDAFCDDGLFCNGTEHCDAVSGCMSDGNAPNCNDGINCTSDRCDEDSRSCVN